METNNQLHNTLSLKELIREVQRELVESQREREESGEEELFEVEKLVLEVNFIVTQSNDVKGGLEFKVLTFGGVHVGGGNNLQEQQVHKVTLSLKAISPAVRGDETSYTGGRQLMLPDFDKAAFYNPKVEQKGMRPMTRVGGG